MTHLHDLNQKGTSNIVINAGNTLVEYIREHSRSQAYLWKQVPWWYLEAEGRSGYGDPFPYIHKLYEIGSGMYIFPGQTRVWVDLENGELVHYSFRTNTKSKVNDRAVLCLVYFLEQLNALTILNKLKERAREPYVSCYDQKEQEEWRAEQRKKYNVEYNGLIADKIK